MTTCNCIVVQIYVNLKWLYQIPRPTRRKHRAFKSPLDRDRVFVDNKIFSKNALKTIIVFNNLFGRDLNK